MLEARAPARYAISNGSIDTTIAGLLEPIGNIPPAEAEAAYFASLEETAIAA
jgi:hypothetical protein